jgi:hypothetical protein
MKDFLMNMIDTMRVSYMGVSSKWELTQKQKLRRKALL